MQRPAIRTRRPHLACVIALVVLPVFACKEVTETVVEKSVQAAKETTKGIEEGIDKGRKQGESTDGAVIVSSPADLAGKGALKVLAVRPGSDDPKQADVELAVENTTENPLRLTRLEVIALDKDGFVKRPSPPPGELTVPARAKEKLVLRFEAEASTLKTLRIWERDHALPSPAAP